MHFCLHEKAWFFLGRSEGLKQRFDGYCRRLKRYQRAIYNTEKGGCKEKAGSSDVGNIKPESGQILSKRQHKWQEEGLREMRITEVLRNL